MLAKCESSSFAESSYKARNNEHGLDFNDSKNIYSFIRRSCPLSQIWGPSLPDELYCGQGRGACRLGEMSHSGIYQSDNVLAQTGSQLVPTGSGRPGLLYVGVWAGSAQSTCRSIK